MFSAQPGMSGGGGVYIYILPPSNRREVCEGQRVAGLADSMSEGTLEWNRWASP
jgi:hypothetical protein